MAGNLGIGIGSFLSGLAGGMNTVHEWEKDDLTNKILQRRTDLLESEEKRAIEKDARDAAADAEDRTWKRQDRAVSEADRQANQPLLSAKRDAALTELTDASADRSTKRAAAEEATAAFKAGRYGSIAEAYRAVAVPKVVENFLKNGDTASADAFSKWAADKRVENGINTVGELERSFQRGDWDSVNKHYNSLMSDQSYVPQTGWRYSAEPIKGKDGKTVGLRATTASPDGESTSEDYSDIAQVHQKLMPMISPSTMFAFAKQQLEDQRSSKSERAKSLYKLADDIELEGVKNVGKIAAARARAGGSSEKDYAAGVLQIMRYQSENVRDFAKLPPDEQASRAAQIYEQVRARSGQGGGGMSGGSVPNRGFAPQPQVPSTRNMGGGSPSVPAPTPKSIMPAATQAPARRPVASDFFDRLRAMEKPAAQADVAQRKYDAEYVRRFGFDPAVYTPADVDRILEERETNARARRMF